MNNEHLACYFCNLVVLYSTQVHILAAKQEMVILYKFILVNLLVLTY
jgi:hypothetical protein